MRLFKNSEQIAGKRLKRATTHRLDPKCLDRCKWPEADVRVGVERIDLLQLKCNMFTQSLDGSAGVGAIECVEYVLLVAVVEEVRQSFAERLGQHHRSHPDQRVMHVGCDKYKVSVRRKHSRNLGEYAMRILEMFEHHVGGNQVECGVGERQVRRISNGGTAKQTVLNQVNLHHVASNDQLRSSCEIFRAHPNPPVMYFRACPYVKPSTSRTNQIRKTTCVSVLVILHFGNETLDDVVVSRHGYFRKGREHSCCEMKLNRVTNSRNLDV